MAVVAVRCRRADDPELWLLDVVSRAEEGCVGRRVEGGMVNCVTCIGGALGKWASEKGGERFQGGGFSCPA